MKNSTSSSIEQKTPGTTSVTFELNNNYREHSREINQISGSAPDCHIIENYNLSKRQALQKFTSVELMQQQS